MKLAGFVVCGLAALAIAPAKAQQPTPPDRFVDVPEDHWAYQAVENLRKRGIIVGYPDGRLRGKRTVTRYEAATGLSRFVSEAERASRQQRITSAPGPQGPTGAPGARGPQGPAGLPGQRPAEVDRFHELVKHLQAEVIKLRRELSLTEHKVANTEEKVKK